ncbi:MAG TPA: sigma-54 dependent transcriptional regulator [Burkholderiaceae bacterium]|nr:sigma-54 dependent transcriptional regulator [Burkholderiaceae bacterium]
MASARIDAVGPAKGSAHVLVVDDERHSVDAIRRTLEDHFAVDVAYSADEAQALLEGTADATLPDVILCDQRMPGTTGIEFLKAVRDRWPEIVRIVVSGYTDAEDIVAGVNEAGIHRYVLKPWMPDQLVAIVAEAVDAKRLQYDVRRIDLELRAGTRALRRRVRERQEAIELHHEFDRLVRSSDSPLDEVCRVAQRVSRFDLNILIQGESGTGKELLARAIHHASPRSSRAFVVENCAALPDTLLESELFGHKRGAFTGAYQDHTGLFQRADGGTIFLDEIGDTSPAFQVKLLRVLQEGEVRPIGASQSIALDVRVIAASHRDLEAEVRGGRFREDLYYRLSGVTLTLPPLRERLADVAVLAQALLEQAAGELGLPCLGFAPDALACITTYPWPGNIRELRNEIQRGLALSDGGPVSAAVLSPRILRGGAGETLAVPIVPQSGTLQQRLDAIEAALLKEALLRHRWNKTQAAKELGLSRVGLRQKLVRFGLEER